MELTVKILFVIILILTTMGAIVEQDARRIYAMTALAITSMVTIGFII